MKTIILYASKYGSTEECAKMLTEALEGIQGSIELVKLTGKENVDLTGYSTVIIGGPVYMGKLKEEVKIFCTQHAEELKTKNLGLFTCGMREGEEALSQLDAVFPQELVKHAKVKDHFGGEFVFQKMNFLEKLIIKAVAKAKDDSSTISPSRIQGYARRIKN